MHKRKKYEQSLDAMRDHADSTLRDALKLLPITADDFVKKYDVHTKSRVTTEKLLEFRFELLTSLYKNSREGQISNLKQLQAHNALEVHSNFSNIIDLLAKMVVLTRLSKEYDEEEEYEEEEQSDRILF